MSPRQAAMRTTRVGARTRWPKTLRGPGLALLVALATCGGALSAGCVAGGPQAKKAPTYADQAQAAYAEAEEAFEAGEYLEAIRRYNIIRTKFPYSQLAPMSDLRIADAYVEQEKYATAIEQYRTFIKLYADHPQLTYANWRIALCFYKQMPEDWFLIPPGYERDLARARDAQRELGYFLDRFPQSQFSQEARQKLLLTRRRMADHELYVAVFYLKRDNPRAAAMRLTYLLKNFSGLGLDAQALFLLARAYLELKDVDKALVALRDLIAVHPQTEQATKARDYLRRHNLTPKP